MRAVTTIFLILACAACGGSADAPNTGAGSDGGGATAAPAPAPPGTVSMTPSAGDPVLDAEWQLIRTVTRQFYDGDLESLYQRFSPGMREEWTVDKLADFRAQTLATYGTETETVAGKREEREGYRAFKRAVRYSEHDGLVEIAWVLNAENEVAGLFITPEQQ